VRVKGKQKAIKIYEPVGNSTFLSKYDSEQLLEHNEALAHYQSGNWLLAQKQLYELYQQTNEAIYSLYCERINENEGKPPHNWQGVYAHSSK